MKRALLWLLIAGLVAAGAVLRFHTDLSPRSAHGLDARRAAPDNCISAYFQALKAGNEDGYLNCLSYRLRAEMRQRYSTPGALGYDLRAQGKDLRAWIVFGEEREEGSGVAVWVDQQFSDARKRQKIHLDREGSSWQISYLEPAQDLAQEVPFGTHVSKVPEKNRGETPEEAEP